MQPVRSSLARAAPIAARIATQTPVVSSARVAVATVPRAQVRAMSTTPVLGKEDRSWVDKGSINFAELEPYTNHPDGSIDIIDVREPNEVAQGCIPASVNVPLSEFSEAFDVNSDSVSSSEFQRRFSFPRPSYDHKIVFYCRSGKRSDEALQIARQRGWWNTRNYPGSWLDWVDHKKKAHDDDD